MMKLKSLVCIFVFAIMAIGTISASAAEEINIGTFRNVIAGSQASNNIVSTKLSTQNSTGWRKINDSWYYFNANGKMQIGWFNDNGAWYYFNSDGTMAHDTTIDNFKLASNGAWIN